MNRNTLTLAAVALVSMLAGVLLFNALDSGSRSEPEAVEATSPELHSIPLTGLDDVETRLSDWHEQILVINFWAPWCAPCRREIPALIEINREFAERGVRVLGIAFDNAQQVERFAADYAIDYPLFLTENRSAMYNVAFDNPSGSLPYTALLDRNLRIVYQHNGELTAEQLRQELEKLL